MRIVAHSYYSLIIQSLIIPLREHERILLNKNEFVLIYVSDYLMFHNIHMYIVFIIYRPGARGIRRNIS